jgi:hypothetical protein
MIVERRRRRPGADETEETRVRYTEATTRLNRPEKKKGKLKLRRQPSSHTVGENPH